MKVRLAVVGMNHRSVPVEVRERYAIPTDDIPEVCRLLVDHDTISEAAVLSTCNRVEIYVAVAEGATVQQAIDVATARLGPPISGIYAHHGLDAVRHLFTVGSSLDSLVLGEPQILGQVKEAWHLARQAGTVGPILGGAFTRTFKAAKKIRTDTGIARSAVSVGHVAVELAKSIFGDVSEVQVLLVGAGKMGVMAAQNLSDSGARKVLVANRTFERGEQLAKAHGWTASAYGDLPYLLQAVDVVICSTGSPRPVLTPDIVGAAVKKRRYRPLFLIDIAVPRDIDPTCGDLGDVYLYNIDDLEAVSRTNQGARADAVESAEAILERELDSFERWSREREAAPVIKRLRESAHATAAAEATRALRRLPDLDEKGVATVNKLAEVIANRLIQGPIVALKQASGGPRGEELAAFIEEAFGLEQDE